MRGAPRSPNGTPRPPECQVNFYYLDMVCKIFHRCTLWSPLACPDCWLQNNVIFLHASALSTSCVQSWRALQHPLCLRAAEAEHCIHTNSSVVVHLRCNSEPPAFIATVIQKHCQSSTDTNKMGYSAVFNSTVLQYLSSVHIWCNTNLTGNC